MGRGARGPGAAAGAGGAGAAAGRRGARATLAALAGAAALLLLVLARLPLPEPPRPPPRPRPHTHPPAPLPTPASLPPPAPISASGSGSTTSPAAAAAAAAGARPSPPARAAQPPGKRPVLVRDVYAAGYSSPHPELCPSLGAHLKLLILVMSAPSHAAARDAVRLTWGHYAMRSDVAVGFVLGEPPAALRPRLRAEDALYGDLIVGRSVDSYSNLTLKTVSMLEWADTFCPRAPHLFKTDDDMFVNVERLLRFAAARANATRTIWGRVIRKSLPKRTPKAKYYVPPEQFAGGVFPDFATGPGYLLTGDCVGALRAAAPAQPYLRLEDVFVTGVLAARLGIARRNAPEFYNRKIAGHPCALRRGISVHMVRWHEQFDFWRKLLDDRTKCGAS